MIQERAQPWEAVVRMYFYMTQVGIAAILVGVVLAFVVGYEWFYHGVSHEVLALLAGVALLFGTQLLVFSLMASMLVTLYREQSTFLEGGDA